MTPDVDTAALRAEHERVFITVDGEQTAGSCGTCTPRRSWPCASWLAAEEIDRLRADISSSWTVCARPGGCIPGRPW